MDDVSHKKRQGLAYVGVMVVLGLLTLFGLASVYLSDTHHRLQSHHLFNEEAFYCMQAGMEFASRKIRALGASIGAIAGTYEFGSCQFTLTDALDFKVDVTAVRGSIRVTYRARIEPP